MLEKTVAMIRLELVDLEELFQVLEWLAKEIAHRRRHRIVEAYGAKVLLPARLAIPFGTCYNHLIITLFYLIVMTPSYMSLKRDKMSTGSWCTVSIEIQRPGTLTFVCSNRYSESTPFYFFFKFFEIHCDSLLAREPLCEDMAQTNNLVFETRGTLLQRCQLLMNLRISSLKNNKDLIKIE